MKTLSILGISVGIAWLCIDTASAIIGGDTNVVKCVKLNPAQTYTASYSSYMNQIDWSASGGGVTVRGIAVCASISSSVVADKRSALSTSYTSNKYCWCRMTEPALSTYWVRPEVCSDSMCYDASSMTPAQCSQYCAYFCARTMSKTSTTGNNPLKFRTALFGDLQ